MTLKECYEILGGGYEDVLSRFMSERLVQKFVIKFLDDKSFDTLKSSLEIGNYEEAFRAAHTIKGICQNLGFEKLLHSSSSLTEALRNKQYNITDELFLKVQADYIDSVRAINVYNNDHVLCP